MFENNSKFPRFIIFMLIALSVFLLGGAFFGESVVSIIYFIGLIVLVVFSMLDKKYGMTLTNHKVVYFLLDLINLIAVASILIYEFNLNNKLTNITLILLMSVVIALVLIDLFVLNDKYSVKRECMIINVIKIFSNICVFVCFNVTYYFWFAIASTIFELVNLIIRVVVTCNLKKSKHISEEIVKNNDELVVEDLIHLNAGEGDME
ncbi:MAG: hypothetical protein IJX17_03450 [Clostridia bacterium]|nr:hypothetical protein [Clostridia bacterium]